MESFAYGRFCVLTGLCGEVPGLPVLALRSLPLCLVRDTVWQSVLHTG